MDNEQKKALKAKAPKLAEKALQTNEMHVRKNGKPGMSLGARLYRASVKMQQEYWALQEQNVELRKAVRAALMFLRKSSVAAKSLRPGVEDCKIWSEPVLKAFEILEKAHAATKPPKA